ncbi:MAG: hypothetical protein K8S55_16210, partial [Phycisphaerae bacterium]|nr:hypothetical protein [Phycisphaerae bacterium]
RPRVAYEKARSTGVYRMTFTRPDQTVSEVLFARNPDPTEGDLTPGGRDELTAALGNGDYVYISRGDTSGEDEEDIAEKKDYWIWLVAALLVLLATETYLARKFGHW